MKRTISDTIERLAEIDQREGITSKFNVDGARTDKYGFDFDGVYFDFSKTHIDQELLSLYDDFAKEIQFTQKKKALFRGEKINVTEQRSVLHTLLRDSTNQGIETQERVVLDQAKESETQFTQRYEEVVSKLKQRSTPVTDIIHVGIGGSSLGTQLLFESLVDLDATIKVHFISNVDAHKLVKVLDDCNVNTTLVIGVSKTFSTAETLQNINTIGAWFEANGVAQWMSELYAVTSKPSNAFDFGVPSENVFEFPEWVGGRYSVWSAVSLSAVLVIGIERFNAFLAGAAAMDKHFYTSEPEENVCFIAAVLDHYYANFMGVKSKAIFSYDHRMRSLVDYLQQLETESNGKDRQIDGKPADQSTSMVVWGGVGTDVQHSVFQMLHQGTSMIPSEFILVKEPNHGLLDHHRELMANGLAQTAALLSGQDLGTVKELNKNKSLSELTMKSKIFSGERPSMTLLLEKLTPFNLGQVLAFYEHRTFCGGVFTNINSFDQMGVELGKRLAKSIRPLLNDSSESKLEQSDEQEIRSRFDASTLNLLDRIMSK